ncbi:MAG: glycosyltransferase family 4 protein [Polyangiaceae bacterium]|nr:glycosyltransferase family 4 protein [Polyangiaceae bacterium]
MRLLLLSNLYPPDVLGGYELLARDVTDHLRARGHDVHVLTSGPARSDDPSYVHRSLELASPFDQPASLDRLRHARMARQHRDASRSVAKLGFDGAVVMSLRRLGFHAVRPLQEAGLRPVYCFNDDWLLSLRPYEAASPAVRLAWRMLERGPLASRTWSDIRIDHAVYVSRSIRDALVNAGAPVPPGVVCFQGVDRKLFWKRPATPTASPLKLLYAGRIHPTKGCDIAIRALGRLARAGFAATLTLAGTGSAEELDRLRGVARDEQVEALVTFAGFVERTKLGDVYRAHDVFLFPSIWEEPAGLTYLEAMACGVPVVALARGGAKELLVDRDNCRVVDGDETMASAIRELAGDTALVERIVDGGVRTVERRASLDRYVETIENAVIQARKAA